jgi:hypothetical protein
MTTPEQPSRAAFALLQTLQGAHPNRKASEVWFVVLNIPQGDWIKLHIRLASFARLVDDVAEAVRNQLDANPHLFLRWKHPVRQLVAFSNLDAPWQSAAQHLRPEVMQGVEFCDRLLDVRRRSIASSDVWAVGSAELLSEEAHAEGLEDPRVKKTGSLLGRVALFLRLGSSATQIATTVLALTQGHLH